MQEANAAVADLRRRMSAIPSDTMTSVAGPRLLGQVLRAEDEATVDGMWIEFTILAQSGLEETIVEGGGGQGVFLVQRQRLALAAQNRELAAFFGSASASLEGSALPSWNRLAPTPRNLWTLPSRPSTKGACSWLSSALSVSSPPPPPPSSGWATRWCAAFPACPSITTTFDVIG